MGSSLPLGIADHFIKLVGDGLFGPTDEPSGGSLVTIARYRT